MLLLSASHVILAANANNIAAERDTETDSDTIKPDTIKLGTIKLDTIKSGVIKPSTIKSGTIKSVEPVSTTKFILPPDHQSRYSINKFDSHVGDMHNTLKQTGNQVKYTSKTKATGFASLFVKNDVNEISRLNWFESNSERTLRQQNYQLLRGKKHKKNQTISFDWSSIKDNSTNDNLTNKDLNNVKINGSYKNRTYEFVTEQPVWSRHFLPLLMSNELLSSEGKQTDTFHITDKGSSQK